MSDLVTCMVSANSGRWEVTYISDSRAPRDFKSPGLSDCVKRASDEIAALYAGTVAGTHAELQFAIYPFSEGASVILDVTVTSDGYSASDLKGEGLRFEGKTLEVLIDRVRASFAGHNNAMFRWVIPVSQLPLK
ncbi:MAG: hypothetical protein E6I04_03885 [Chloroflexi bacterium]|nr:MAG: hypothetical protein E6I04_03885 [Chloroflexota bacterium]